MAIWGVGPLENDAAQDLLGEIRRGQSQASILIEEALERVLEDHKHDIELTVDVCARGVASALLVAEMESTSDDELVDVLESVGAVDKPHLSNLALQALRICKVDSEFADLVDEAGDLEAWKDELRTVESRLSNKG
jgi:hypothetical protein